MSYRSLLVLLDNHPLAPARTAFALRLAGDLGCSLLGVAPTGIVNLPVTSEAAGTLTEFAAVAKHSLRDQAERAAQRFRNDCAAAGLESFDAITDECDEAESLVRQGHCCDLVLVSQADPSKPGHRKTQELIEQVVLRSARPTLVIPYAGRFDHVGTHVMVAWDDSREATRAVTDALPLLRRAKRVQAVSWNESGQRDDKAIRARLEALQRWLKSHDVTAEVHVEKADMRIANAMLSCAADLNADLIVMGAYGHARWAERMLGGATRGLLASMTVPVLMSH